MLRTFPRSALLAVLPAAAALAGGCAQGGGYPSLAPRPAELADVGAPTPPAPPATADDPALAARITALIAQARQGQEAFERERQRAGAAVARAGRSGSESWIEAQQAISYLESVRGPTVTARAELDELLRSRAEMSASEADRAALLAASEEVDRIADQQRQEIARLTASLG